MKYSAVCTADELNDLYDQLGEKGVSEIRAKRLDSVRYLVTWVTEDKDDENQDD